MKTFPLCVQRTVSVQSQHFTPPAAQEPLTWSGQGHELQILISEMELSFSEIVSSLLCWKCHHTAEAA